MVLDEFKTTVLLIAMMGLAMFVVGAVLYDFVAQSPVAPGEHCSAMASHHASSCRRGPI